MYMYVASIKQEGSMYVGICTNSVCVLGSVKRINYSAVLDR